MNGNTISAVICTICYGYILRWSAIVSAAFLIGARKVVVISKIWDVFFIILKGYWKKEKIEYNKIGRWKYVIRKIKTRYDWCNEEEG